MWTCPIVFLSANPAMCIFMTGLYRSSEVILGGIVGVMLHIMAEAIIRHSIKLRHPNASDETQDNNLPFFTLFARSVVPCFLFIRTISITVNIPQETKS